MRRSHRRRGCRLLGVAVLVIAGLPSGAHAQAEQDRDGFTLDRYQAPRTVEDGLARDLPETLGHLRPSVALAFEYAHAPLVLVQGADRDHVGDVVGDQMVLHLAGALGIGERLQISLVLPVTVFQSGEEPTIPPSETLGEPSTVALADPSLGASVWLVGEHGEGFQLGLSGTLPVPLGSSDDFSGDGGVGGRGRLLGAFVTRGFTVSAGLGAAYRPNRTFDTVRVGSELLFDAGVYVPVGKRVTLVGELLGATGLRSDLPFTDEGTPLELLLGVRASAAGLVVGAGVGPGLTRAPGVPDVRTLVTAGYAPRRPRKRPPPPVPVVEPEPEAPPEPEPPPEPAAPPEPADRDEDGIPDDEDRCTDEPEDRDDFQDDDGCPDPDNDGDGVLDGDDQCPNQPETRNGVDDEDGCPDTVRVEDGQIRVLQRIEFETNRSVIRPGSFPVLAEVKIVLESTPRIRLLRIEGHTDNRGPDAHNQSLSERRARSVMRWLVENGVAPSRLQAQGLGESRPIEPNETRDGRRANRRVEFHIVEDPGAEGDTR